MQYRYHPLRLMVAGLVLAIAGSASLVANAATPDAGPMARHGMHGGPMGGMGGMGGLGGRHFGRALDAVNATPQQRAQIAQIMDAARNDLRGQRESGRALHEQMRQAFTQPSVDARSVEALRQQLMAQHDQASRRMAQAMLEASQVLSAEQRQKLGELMAQRRSMMERHRAERESLERRR